MAAYTAVPLAPQSGVTGPPPQGMTMPFQPGLPMFTAPVRSQVKTERKTYKQTLYWFGFVEMILGILSCLLSLIGLFVHNGYRSNLYSESSPGLWCGMFLIFSGVMAMKLDKVKSTSRVYVNMVVSVVTSLLMVVMFVLSALACFGSYGVILVIHILLCIFASAGFVLCVVHAAFCCATSCCLKGSLQRESYQCIKLADGSFAMVRGPLIIQSSPPSMSYPSAPCPIEYTPISPLPENVTGMEPPPYEPPSQLQSSPLTAEPN